MSIRYRPPIVRPSAYLRNAREVTAEDVRARAIAAMQLQRAALRAAGVSPLHLPEVHDRMSPVDMTAAQAHMNELSGKHGVGAPKVPSFNPSEDDELASLTGTPKAVPTLANPTGAVVPRATGLNSGGQVLNTGMSAPNFDGVSQIETPAGKGTLYDPRNDQGIITAPTAPGFDRSVYVDPKFGGGVGSVSFGPPPTSQTGRMFDETGDVTPDYTAPGDKAMARWNNNQPATPSFEPEAATAPPPQAPNPGSGVPISTPLGSTSTEDDVVGAFAKSPFDDQFKKNLMYTGFSRGMA